jgi:hypothetical protein
VLVQRSTFNLCLTSLAAVIPLISACGPTNVDGQDSDDLIGGISASDPRFDAVGSIALFLDDDNGEIQHVCTGALIGPHTVLTATNCFNSGGASVLRDIPATFRLGRNADAPTREIRVVSGSVGPLQTGGIASAGTDLSIVQLEEDITDVKPLPVSFDPLTSKEIGHDFVVASVGPTAQGEPPLGGAEVRRFGRQSLLALTGDALVTEFPTVQDYINYIVSVDPNADQTKLATFYNTAQRPMVLGEQAAFTGLKDNGVEACGPDTGGPVFRQKDGNLEIIGIEYATMAFDQGKCLAGDYVGLVAPDANKTFIQNALSDPTRGVPATGACDETLAVTSNPASSGAPAISSFECSDLGLVCGSDPDGQATCVDPPSGGAASSCSIVGSWFGGFSVFNADGTQTGFDFTSGTYTLEDAILSITDSPIPAATCAQNEIPCICLGTTGTYAVNWAPDCSSFTTTVIQDRCGERVFGNDRVTYVH